MKKLLGIALASVLLVTMAVPVAAADVGTSVTVSTGGGSVPVVMCKWEQEPDNNIYDKATPPNNLNKNNVNQLESGDAGTPAHQVPFSQFNPPMIKNSLKLIQYFAVVTDEEDGGNVAQVFADVFHPNNAPAPYNQASFTPIGNEDPALAPFFKYEIPFAKYTATSPAAKDLVIAAANAGLIKFQGTLALTDITNTNGTGKLDKGTAALWAGSAYIDYEQPAGLYTVYVFGVDSNQNLSAYLLNNFTYMDIAGVEFDFSSVNYGPVNLGQEKMVAGDRTWDANTAPVPVGYGFTPQATVRNIGNTWVKVTLNQTDMGFGKDVNGQWNVQYDGRMGSDQAYYEGDIMPLETRTLPNALGLSKQEELDLSIKVIKGFGTHSGTLTIGSVKVFPFVVPVPAWVVGIPAP